MRTSLLLAALVLAGFSSAPGALATTTCDYYTTTHTLVPFTGYHVTEQRYKCFTHSGGKAIDQRADILRIADGEPGSASARLVMHVEYQSLFVKDLATGKENRENFVMLMDGTGRVPYTEAEYKDERGPNQGCQGRASVYRGSQYFPVATAAVPGCPPVRELLP